MKFSKVCAALAAFVVSASCAFAERGPVTNLPMPRFVSLKASEGNVRRGPSLSHRIDWVFKHRNMPLKVVAEHGHWRRVVDRQGAGGWVHFALLSGSRFGLVETDQAPLFRLADQSSGIVARTEQGALLKLGKCDTYWCRVSADGVKGWVERAHLWGLLPQEVRD